MHVSGSNNLHCIGNTPLHPVAISQQFSIETEMIYQVQEHC